ncbi:Mucin-associated surface protein (MASP) [Trypanosoma cruzi]|uniref:Mucin-associated surface protein (MASP), putative n=2 Tax=Trypanosoma cruzi TaxID=5693 RepID=Q4E4Z7_TRYCC|nr:mucin-associated surface protein (MASP), putative [Trypanosoma cruzi]EAN99869.1 mucin-associated surface protein (MASP), putative [Trypanosoma cruzi]PWV17785.1 Mucin-associated surface protein (MASP) [Trypanosoma cruzi]RNC42064.1 mucin-associated surface protein (MASP) [Trypanosoma cruzi]|eukprot:XP_821720.1 mucin-associated surface protein (MASP) [Trypanosoma cruzi strain CL Brener]
MAMMTGRVLLVCALCVLWCGAVFVSAAGDGDGDGRGVSEKAPKGLPEPGERGANNAGHSSNKNNEINSNLQGGTGTGTTTDRVVKEEEEEEEEAETDDDDDDDDDDDEKDKSNEKEDTPQAGKSESSSKEVAATIPTASGLSGAGGGSPSGDVGSSGSPDGSEDLNLEASGPVVNSSPPLSNAAAGGLQNADGALPSQKNNFSETGVHSGTTPPTPSLPKSQAPAITQPKAEEQSPTEQDTEDSPDTEEVHPQDGEVNGTALNSSLGHLSQMNNSDAGTMRGSGLLPLLLLLLGLWGFAAL